MRDVEASKAFYTEALRPLGYELTMEYVEGAGYGAQGKSDFFLAQRSEPARPSTSPSAVPTARRSTSSTRRRWPRAAPTTARPASGVCTTSTTTARTSSIQKATTSRLSRTSPNDRSRKISPVARGSDRPRARSRSHDPLALFDLTAPEVSAALAILIAVGVAFFAGLWWGALVAAAGWGLFFAFVVDHEPRAILALPVWLALAVRRPGLRSPTPS